MSAARPSFLSAGFTETYVCPLLALCGNLECTPASTEPLTPEDPGGGEHGP